MGFMVGGEVSGWAAPGDLIGLILARKGPSASGGFAKDPNASNLVLAFDLMVGLFNLEIKV